MLTLNEEPFELVCKCGAPIKSIKSDYEGCVTPGKRWTWGIVFSMVCGKLVYIYSDGLVLFTSLEHLPRNIEYKMMTYDDSEHLGISRQDIDKIKQRYNP